MSRRRFAISDSLMASFPATDWKRWLITQYDFHPELPIFSEYDPITCQTVFVQYLKNGLERVLQELPE